MTIKLSELRAAFEAMTFKRMSNTDNELLDEENAEIGEVEDVRDAVGIVAIHNATPVLLEIVEAALAFQEQRADNLMAALSVDESSTSENGHDPERRAKTLALSRALGKALAKVQP